MIMIRCLSFTFTVSALLTFHSSNAIASEPSITSKLLTPSPLGKDRILVVCVGDSINDTKLDTFYNSVNLNQFSERQLTLVEVGKWGVASVISLEGSSKPLKARHDDFGNQLRETANCQNDFDTVLIGKDTGVKARWTGMPPMDALFDTIDAMPMRKFEIRQQRRDKN